MDPQLGVGALTGAVLSWLVVREPSSREPLPCHCQCGCSEPEDSSPHWILLGSVIVVLLILNLFVVLRITLPQNEKGELEVGVAVKGKAGKGWYGASSGLQILDRD